MKKFDYRRAIFRMCTLILVGCVSLGAVAAQLSRTITLGSTRMSVEHLFEEITRQSGMEIFYNYDDLDPQREIVLPSREMTAEQLLGIALGNNYSWRQNNNSIVVSRAAQQPPVAAQVRITGRVTDGSGRAMVGVSVQIDGTSRGTVTDATGRFAIPNVTLPARINFSYMGFESQQATLTTNRVLAIVMRPSHIQLRTAVIHTGYNDIDKGMTTGSVFEPELDSVELKTANSVVDMLQGVVPGMTVINTSGQVGAAPKIRIRGTSTIYGNQSPLWVVDGVIQRDPLPIDEAAAGALGDDDIQNLREVASSAISWLNPMDIENITVLKDASSTAIYGSQASNGVIVITTKKARSGQLSVSYSGSFSVGQKPTYDKYDMMNSQELMQLSQEIYTDRNTYGSPLAPLGYANLVYRLQNKQISQTEFDREFRKMENQNTDWFDILFRNQLSQIHNISVTGGGETLTNRTSLGVQRVLGEARGNDMNNLMANSTTTLRLGEKLIANFVLNASNSKRSGFGFGVDPFSYAMNTSRTIPLYNDDGSLFYHQRMGLRSTAIADREYNNGGVDYYNFNILNELDNTSNTNSTQTLASTFDLTWFFGNGFDLRGMFSYSTISSDVRSYATEFSHYITQIRGYEIGEEIGFENAFNGSPLPFGGVSINENAKNQDWSTRLSLNYNRVFNDKHKVFFQLGGEARSARTYGHKDTSYGYLHYRGEKYADVPLAPVNIVGAAEQNSRTSLHTVMRNGTRNSNAISNFLSTYMTAIYNYDDRYTFNFNARADASNRFGQDKNKKFEPNWSAGFKWRLGNEDFVSLAGWMDMVDLSFSYGYTGTAVQSVSPYLIATDAGLDEFYDRYSLQVKSLPYPGLGWEKKRDWNAGVDMSFLQGRLSLQANLFASNSDVLNFRNVPLENGVQSGIVMGQKMKNYGWDIFVNVVPIRTRDWMWSLTFNTGMAKSKMDSSEQINDRDMYLTGQAIIDGMPYSTFYSYSYAGLDGEHGYPTYNYMDVDGAAADLDPRLYMVRSGQFDPKFQGGLATSLRYKNFSLRAQFAMSMGAHSRLPKVYNAYGAPQPDQNAPRFLIDRWREPGDENNAGVMPAIPDGNRYAGGLFQLLPGANPKDRVTQNRYNMWALSDARVASADFIRCRNISLSWNVPNEWVKGVVGNVSLSLAMSNPFLITFDKRWDGYDPETGNWPLRRTTTLNLSVQF